MKKELIASSNREKVKQIAKKSAQQLSTKKDKEVANRSTKPLTPPNKK